MFIGPNISASTTTSVFDFWVCSEIDVRNIVKASLNKMCALDLIPTFLLKETISLLLFLTTMTNVLLCEDTYWPLESVPADFSGTSML